MEAIRAGLSVALAASMPRRSPRCFAGPRRARASARSPWRPSSRGGRSVALWPPHRAKTHPLRRPPISTADRPPQPRWASNERLRPAVSRHPGASPSPRGPNAEKASDLAKRRCVVAAPPMSDASRPIRARPYISGSKACSFVTCRAWGTRSRRASGSSANSGPVGWEASGSPTTRRFRRRSS